MAETSKTIEVDDAAKNININLGNSDIEGDIAQRLVELEARLAALESQLSGDWVKEEDGADSLNEADVADVEEAGENQAADQAMVEEVYRDDEDIVNLRGNLKTAKRLTERRFNLADFVADKTQQKHPENLEQANAILATFRKTYSGLKAKRENWSDAQLRRANSASAKTPHERYRNRNSLGKGKEWKVENHRTGQKTQLIRPIRRCAHD